MQILAYPGRRATRETQVTQDQLDRPAQILPYRDQPAHRDRKAPSGRLDLRATPDLRVPTEAEADRKDLRVPMARRALPAQTAPYRGHRDPPELTERLAHKGLQGRIPLSRVQQALTALLVLPERMARRVQLELTRPYRDQPALPEQTGPKDLLALLVLTAPSRDLRAQLARMAQQDLQERTGQLAQPEPTALYPDQLGQTEQSDLLDRLEPQALTERQDRKDLPEPMAR